MECRHSCTRVQKVNLLKTVHTEWNADTAAPESRKLTYLKTAHTEWNADTAAPESRKLTYLRLSTQNGMQTQPHQSPNTHIAAAIP